MMSDALIQYIKSVSGGEDSEVVLILILQKETVIKPLL